MRWIILVIKTMQILQCSLSHSSLFFIYSRINILLLLEHSIFPRNFILEIRGYNQSFSRSRHNTMLFTCTTIEELESRAEKIFFFSFCHDASRLQSCQCRDLVTQQIVDVAIPRSSGYECRILCQGGGGGYQYWYSTSRSSPLLKSLDPVIDEHSVEQSLRYRRLVYRIISSIISRRYQTRKSLNKNEKRILEYSLPVCLSQRWIRDFLFSPRR